MTNTYRIANQIIQIESLYEKIHEQCHEYRFDGKPDFAVRIGSEDILYEETKSAREREIEGLPGCSYAEAYLETLAVYRKIAERMPEYDTFLFHGSCVAVDGKGYIFTAKSGTGKSTHTRLWRELLGDRVTMVNDDKPLIRIADGKAIVYGTPWDGKHHLSNNIAVPLKAVCILDRDAENCIRTITPSEALPMLLQQVYRPMDAAAMAKTLNLIDCLSKSVELYRLGCNINIEAAKVAYEAMRGKTI